MLTPEQREIFEKEVKAGSPVSVIAQRVGVSRQLVYERIKYYSWTFVYSKAKLMRIVEIMKQHEPKTLESFRSILKLNGYKAPAQLSSVCNAHNIEYIQAKSGTAPKTMYAVCLLLRTRLTTKEISERSGVSLQVLCPLIQRLRKLGFEPTAKLRHNATAIGTYPKSEDDIL